jgi:hypothetical protein
MALPEGKVVVSPEIVEATIREVPSTWLEARGVSAAELIKRLCDYAEAAAAA